MSNYTKQELLKIYDMELGELFALAKGKTFDDIELCSLISARTGICSQNCKYCAQSSHYRTNIETHPFVSVDTVRQTAIEARDNKATRFAVVTSGKTPDEGDFDTILGFVKEINKAEGLSSCASIGILNEEQAIALKEAGLKRFHHNINTCKSYHEKVCTTHTYQDRINTINLVRKYGMELCCGVIIGMGETTEQRIEMAMELAEIAPDSIPVNILTPIEGTPFESYGDQITEEEILRTLALFKIAVPQSRIRFAGGRASRLSKANRDTALKNCVDSILIGNYLTTIGIEPSEDQETIDKIGKRIHV